MDIKTFLNSIESICSTPAGIKELRIKVLDLAIKGMLVAQDPSDEPAGKLMDEVELEREELVKEKIIAKQKKVPTIDSTPFEIPKSWKWVQTQDAGEIQLGRQRAPKYDDGPHMVPYLRVANVQDGFIDISDVKEMNFDPNEQKKYSLRHRDILLNEGGLVGRTSLYKDELPFVCFQNSILRYRCFQGIIPEYMFIVFRHYFYTGRFKESATKTTIAHLGATRLAAIEVPIPPTNEQRRIISKEQELSGMINRIEALQLIEKEASSSLSKVQFW